MGLDSNDSAFLYFIFTLQAILLLVLIYDLGTTLPFKSRRAKASPQTIAAKIFLFAFATKWAYDTYLLVESDVTEGNSGFDPYKLLHIDNDASFNT